MSNEVPVIITPVSWAEAKAELMFIRETVFMREQGVPVELEWDGLDEACVHVLARCEGQPVGTARLLADGHIGRMSVLPAWRGRGVGGAMLQRMIQIAQQRGLSRVILDAQTHAIPFYARHGFTIASDVFMDAGMPHQTMIREFTHADR